MLVVGVVKRLVMMPPPCFEVSCAADVLLHLLLPVHFGLHHHRLLDNIGDEALALEWAATHLLQLPNRDLIGSNRHIRMLSAPFFIFGVPLIMATEAQKGPKIT